MEIKKKQVKMQIQDLLQECFDRFAHWTNLLFLLFFIQTSCLYATFWIMTDCRCLYGLVHIQVQLLTFIFIYLCIFFLRYLQLLGYPHLNLVKQIFTSFFIFLLSFSLLHGFEQVLSALKAKIIQKKKDILLVVGVFE